MGPIKAAGKYRQEGKSYVRTRVSRPRPVVAPADFVVSQVVQDGDIIHFQFSTLRPLADTPLPPAFVVGEC